MKAENSLYLNRYENFIKSRKYRVLEENIYTEKHHILPRSLGGGEEDNIIILSGREHFLAHLMLWKAYRNKEMVYAFNMMSGFGRYEKRLSSKQYNILKEEYSFLCRNRTFSKETREKMRIAKLGKVGNMLGKKHSQKTKDKISLSKQGKEGPNKGKTFTEEHKKNLSVSHKGYKNTEESKRKMSISKKGIKFTEKHKQNISDSKKGNKNPNYNKKTSLETKEKIRQSMKKVWEDRRKRNV